MGGHFSDECRLVAEPPGGRFSTEELSAGTVSTYEKSLWALSVFSKEAFRA